MKISMKDIVKAAGKANVKVYSGTIFHEAKIPAKLVEKESK